MDNQTHITFYLLPFSTIVKDNQLIFVIFLSIYLAGVTLNLLVITVICLHVHLHTPMYLFLCNLSTIDICYTTFAIPKLLHILLSGNGLISFTQCFVQIYFFVVCNSAESLVFLALGLDRYIAICHPLSYHRILNKKICLLISAIMWIFAFLNSLIILNSLVNLPFYGVVIIHSFFCDATDVFNTSHGVSQEFQIIIAIELVFLEFSPVFFNFWSYGKIIRVILHIKSKDGRKKAFSTCLPHLITMSMYYSAGFVEYLVSNQDPTGILKQMLSVIYVILVPMINPLIYSLHSSEILRACRKLLKIKEPSVRYYSNKVEN